VSTVEEVIPRIHQLLVIFPCNLFDPPQFLSRKASTSFQADWIEPNFSFAIITFHMYVARFITVTGIEEKSVWANSQDGRHQSLAKCVSFGIKGGLQIDRFRTGRQR
jgi:hypothetical protein